MKKTFLSILLILCAFSFFAQTKYYVSNTGNDNNTGTSSSTPWQSISKINSTVTFVPGDTLFLKSGNVFVGQLSINQGGSSSSPVVITSYGLGPKPIISGADTISGWTVGGTINGYTYYQVNFPSVPTSFFVNNIEQIIARYPNRHSYLTVDSAQNVYLKDASLSGLASNLITGAKLCIHSEQWCWEKTEVASYSGNQITYTIPTIRKTKDKYGYFLYDNISHLDTINEWIYDSGMIKYIPPTGQDPNTFLCLASVDTNGIVIGGSATYVTIDNISIQNQTNAGILISGTNNQNIKINNCYFLHQYNYGISDGGKYSEISNSYFREVNGLAISVGGNAVKSTIHHNTFRNNGYIRNHGVGMEFNHSTIKVSFRDSCHIHHNNIDSTGYCGIAADGKYNLIERNIVKNAMLMNNDGAALKSFGPGSQYNVFKNNFVSLSDGNTEGTYNASFITPGIYFDFSTNNCTIEENTIYNRTKTGIFQNSANHDNTIINNVVHRGNYCLDLNGSPIVSSPAMTGMVVKHNSFFVYDNNSYVVRQVDHTGAYNTGILDSNYYFQPFDAAKYVFRAPSTYYDFSQWQATGFDANTKPSFVSWTYPTRYDTLFMNQTDNVANINLGSNKYLDLDSNVVCGSITLQPYTSKILINTNQVCSVGVDEKNNSDVLIYPNPAHDKIFFKGIQQVRLIQIYDALGKKVYESINNNENTIDVSALDKGLYLLQFNIPEESIVKKIIID